MAYEQNQKAFLYHKEFFLIISLLIQIWYTLIGK